MKQLRYYSLRYVSRLPNGWTGMQSLWRIRILNSHRHDRALLEHEKCHVRQWWLVLVAWAVLIGLLSLAWPALLGMALAAPWIHGALYRLRWYRRWAEVQAHQVQIRHGASRDSMVASLVSGYGLGISAGEAERLLR